VSLRALVLAAGWGTRLGALAAGGPKALLPIGRRRAIDFVVDAVEALPSVTRIDVVTNQAFEGMLAAWASRRPPGTPLRVLGDGAREARERRGAIGNLAHYLEAERPRDPLLVLASDNVFDFSLAPLARRAIECPVVALYDVGSRDAVSRLASVELAPDGTVTHFVEKDPAPRTTLACVALYGLPADALPEVGAYLETGGRPDNLGYFVEWLHRRRPVQGVVMEGRWVDVGSAPDYHRARRLFGGASGEASTGTASRRSGTARPGE
jgi:glucose-1-phosphate thymidylyltransferase